jgi:hypothetical protein
MYENIILPANIPLDFRYRKDIRYRRPPICNLNLQTNVQYENCPCALTEHHVMKAYWGSGSMAPRIRLPRK